MVIFKTLIKIIPSLLRFLKVLIAGGREYRTSATQFQMYLIRADGQPQSLTKSLKSILLLSIL